MNVEAVNEYLPVLLFSPKIETEDDLTMKFSLETPVSRESERCGAPVLINCLDSGISKIVIGATLQWQHCGSEIDYEIDPADIEIVSGKTISLSFTIDSADLSNVNEFLLTVETDDNVRTVIARGKVYL